MHSFEGEVTLKINKLENTKIKGYYELVLTDFQGECEPYGLSPDEPCWAEDGYLSLGYFFVDKSHIYQMNNTETFLGIFAEVETFPRTKLMSGNLMTG